LGPEAAVAKSDQQLQLDRKKSDYGLSFLKLIIK